MKAAVQVLRMAGEASVVPFGSAVSEQPPCADLDGGSRGGGGSMLPMIFHPL